MDGGGSGGMDVAMALELLERMQRNNVEPNVISYSSAIAACAALDMVAGRRICALSVGTVTVTAKQ